MQKRLRFESEHMEYRQHGRVHRHLQMLVVAAEAEKVIPSIAFFYLLSGGLSLFSALLFSLVISWSLALPWALMVGAIPYLILQSRLHERRVRRSLEGDLLVQELLNNYQICEYNMLEALEKTALTLQEAPLGKKLFLQLAKDLKNAVTRQEAEMILTEFKYACDTVWGNILASNILFAHLYGIRVDGALRDLLYCMMQSRKAVEYSRRENHEARLMLIWLAPMSFLLSIFFACYFFDFTLAKFFAYQLGTPLGLQWFFSMVFCYTVSLMVHRFLAKEKMDI